MKVKAFGIIEVLIASTIIISIIFAFTALAKATLKTTDQTHERAQAISLAQEGLELVRQMRDTNWTDASSETDWDCLEYNSATGKLVKIGRSPIETYNLKFINSIKRLGLVKDGNPERIPFAGNDSKSFYRRVRVENVGDLLPSNTLAPLPADKNIYSLKVTVEVIMASAQGENDPLKTITLSEILTNWRPQY